ncbi:Endo/exonuclease/phosphatase domain-containing protein [Aphis craccivora]|uniref:Endo/exonuclease/phosphatase domain-containing protein n=1 Tax=Aphis craccivora TaxID=307492 RepID=A0A6G0WN13_APHCR|nr:Endo/exonuclease/phosphatase domain-containing protein [Aphis craccivora]
MDAFTEDYLKLWGFDHLVSRFKEEEIDKIAFLNLTENMVITLIPKMGPQSKFLALLQTLKDEIQKEKVGNSKSQYIRYLINIMNDTKLFKEILSSKSNSEVLSESSNAIDIQNIEMVISEDDFNYFNNEQSSLNISPDESSSTQLFLQVFNQIIGMNSDDCSLGKYINDYQDGKMVLDYYNCHKCLSFTMKNKLSSVLIKHELQKQSDLKINKLLIQNIFPSENQSTYFIPYYKEGDIVSPNRGKLFDKYCNIKRKIIKINPSNKRKHDDEPQLNPCEGYKLQLYNIFSTYHKNKIVVKLLSLNTCSIILIDYEDSLTWLKNHVEPEIVLHKLWNETSLHRLKLHKNDYMMNVYPALKKPTGHCLVDIDFAHLYPDKTMCLFQKFETFKNKLKIYLRDDDLAAFQLIPFLLSPVNVALNNKQILRPSKIEQLHAFIVNIQL